MPWRTWFSRDTRHVRIVAVVLLVGGAVGAWVRQQLVPESFGVSGPYREASLQENATRPMWISSDAKCLKCHDHVGEERAESPHKEVACMHCHGLGHEHIAAAEKAELSGEEYLPTIAEWDGDFMTQVDLYFSHNRAACLACHQRVVGMPESFRSIDVAEHLKEQEASDPTARDVCFECHGHHDPAP